MSGQPTTPFDLIASGRIHIAGGIPTTVPDVPISAVFLVFYIIGAVSNVAMFIRYNKRLRWQMALFGYCMARITTLVLRIAWTERKNNSNLAIASLVFLNAGVIIIFIVNLQMSKKAIFRTHYPYFQENPAKKALLKKIFAAVSFMLLAFLAIVIVGAVQGFLTLDPRLQRIDTILKRIGSTAFLVYSCLPFPILAINAIVRLRTGPHNAAPFVIEQEAGVDTKYWRENRTVWKNSGIILASASLVLFEYGIKTAQGYEDATIHRWYYDKGAFYATGLLPEILAMYILLLSNIARRYGGLRPYGSSSSAIQKDGQSHGVDKTAQDGHANGHAEPGEKATV